MRSRTCGRRATGLERSPAATLCTQAAIFRTRAATPRTQAASPCNLQACPGEKNHVIKTGEGNYRLKTGDLTILRFDGDHGDYSCFVGKGESIHGPETGGNYTYLQVEDWAKWEKKFVYGPYVHHVVGIYGDHRDALFDACRYLDIKYDTPDSDPFI